MTEGVVLGRGELETDATLTVLGGAAGGVVIIADDEARVVETEAMVLVWSGTGVDAGGA